MTKKRSLPLTSLATVLTGLQQHRCVLYIKHVWRPKAGYSCVNRRDIPPQPSLSTTSNTQVPQVSLLKLCIREFVFHPATVCRTAARWAVLLNRSFHKIFSFFKVFGFLWVRSSHIDDAVTENVLVSWFYCEIGVTDEYIASSDLPGKFVDHGVVSVCQQCVVWWGCHSEQTGYDPACLLSHPLHTFLCFCAKS